MTARRSMYREHQRVQLVCEGEGRTKKGMQDECDINSILKRYQRTGLIDHVSRFHGEYGDLCTAPEYHEAMNAVRDAEEAFQSLPARVRSKFSNDPGLFLAFVNDPANLEEMIDMGLAKRKPKPVSGPVEGDPGYVPPTIPETVSADPGA